MAKNTQDRIMVEMSQHRVPLKQILHGMEIREAMANMEKFRQRFNEQEILYGGKVYLDYAYGECIATIKRLETDREYADRQAKIAEAERLKAERRRNRQLQEAAREERRRQEEKLLQERQERLEIDRLRELAAKHGLKLVDDLSK